MPNALDQGATVAATLTGAAPPASRAPYFWSHQYGVKLNTAGLITADADEVVRGDPATGKFAVAYFDGPTLVALDAINRPADFARAKALVGTAEISREVAADVMLPLPDPPQRSYELKEQRL